jgi:hypothetical protein
LVVAATAVFVVGTSIERHESKREAAPGREASGHGEAGSSAGGESSAQHAAEGTPGAHETHAELNPLGIDIEAPGFVALAAVLSLGLVAAGWWRLRWVALLLALAAMMLVFGALDVREVFHQHDEARAGLASLAGVVAALHFAAAALAGVIAATGHGSSGPAPAATMGA